MRSVPYEQAAGSAAPKAGGGSAPGAFFRVVSCLYRVHLYSHIISLHYYYIAKPEKVVNPYGSTAGAGSGEFHVYRHARAREMERIKGLEEEEREELLDQNYNETLTQYKTQQEERTEKRRRKRKRQKEAKLRRKNLKLAGVNPHVEEEEENGVHKEEFTYVPVNGKVKDDEDGGGKKETTKDETVPTKLPFANDGSFLEQMKKRLAAEQEAKQEVAEGHVEEEGPPKKKQEV